MEEAKRAFGERYKDGYKGYEEILLAEADKYADTEAVELDAAFKMAKKARPADLSDEGTTRILDRPTNIGGALFERVSNFFTGRSEQDIVDQAVQNIRKKGYIKNESFEEVFNNILQDDGADRAYNFVKQMDVAGFDENTTVKESVTHKIINDQLVAIKSTETTDSNGNVTIKQEDPVNLIDDSGAVNKAALLKSYRTAYNIGKDGLKTLTEQAQATYVAHLKTLGINAANPKTLEEYEIALEALTEQQSNSNNLANPSKDKLVMAALTELLSSQKLLKISETGDIGATEERIKDTILALERVKEMISILEPSIFNLSKD